MDLSEEDASDDEGGDGADKVAEEAAAHRVAGVLDTYTAEIHGNDIEGSVGGALQYAAQSAYERVGSVCGHGLDHHAAGSATGERFHERSRHGACHIGVDANPCEELGNALLEKLHGSAGAEHTHRYEDSNEVRDDANSRLETTFSAVDKRLIDVDFADSSLDDKPADNS